MAQSNLKQAGLVAGIIGAIVAVAALAVRAKVVPPPPPPPLLTVNDVMRAKSLAELDTLYNRMNDLYTTGQISEAGYNELYQAYVTRFYQLV